MSKHKQLILKVALPRHWYRCFDYLPGAVSVELLQLGMRVQVPLGRAQVVGIVLALTDKSDLPAAQLKPILQVLDVDPILPQTSLELAAWAAEYYQHPIGDVLSHFLPAALRKGTDLAQLERVHFCIAPVSGAPTPKTDAQRRALEWVQDQIQAGSQPSQLAALEAGFAQRTVDILIQNKVLSLSAPADHADTPQAKPGLVLHADQQAALDAIFASQAAKKFEAFLLAGVTGSGKTEVYLQAIEACLAAGRQALVLVPEISLTPQTFARFEARFSGAMAVSHSKMDDNQRARIWLGARSGRLRIVIGTRSALMMPFQDLGLIVVDESHDPSYKQQSGFRYHARDLAQVRAMRANIPIVLGTATPSLESVQGGIDGRLTVLALPTRAGGASMPSLKLLDVRGQQLKFGVSNALKQAVQAQIQAGNQVLFFLNRRGYAPILFCHGCGWRATCQDCDVSLTLHRSINRLRCHYCEFQSPVPEVCPECKASGESLHGLGLGTQKLEEELPKLFPDVPIYRLDRDSLRGKDALAQLVSKINLGEPGILVGTQILAKGHHFEKVALVAVLDADSALYAQDFRGPERLAQLLLQVAGRAGRGKQKGEVLVQTHQPDHPLLQCLIHQGYHAFAMAALESRRATKLPPFGRIAMICADSPHAKKAEGFLKFVVNCLRAVEGASDEVVSILRPMPSGMPKRAGRYHFEILLHSEGRLAIQKRLAACLPQIEQAATAARIRWSVDIDAN